MEVECSELPRDHGNRDPPPIEGPDLLRGASSSPALLSVVPPGSSSRVTWGHLTRAFTSPPQPSALLSPHHSSCGLAVCSQEVVIDLPDSAMVLLTV